MRQAFGWGDAPASDGDEEPRVPEEVLALAEERAEARRAKDFQKADQAREAITAMGWQVTDTPEGFSLSPKGTARSES